MTDGKATRERAVAALDRALDKSPDGAKDDLTDAIRAVAELRDDRVKRWRHTGAADDRHGLDAVNAILSLLAGLEYPLAGIKWKRVSEARDSLKKLS
ncbi:hypothetical protein C882_0677 [Caenispirillum salinarum AK4]|uniref:Uncharacterized protein n=1 Tax=Caenispirillum salinarum AK4 TaxID=1238182 RepID=K9GVX7_9PROT|nr:hypothetical protein [Caenispirillum salinarum]EKV28914.1 hypothetical protein C882_0677 [Caenispirillum salinarum AK4]